MTAIIPLSAGSNLPAYLANRAALAAINSDVVRGPAGFGVLSIKGKVFTLVKDGERKVLTRDDDPDEVLQSINLSVVRANTKSRVFYMKAYVEGSEGDAAKPDCYSSDGVAPAADARNPQAKKCQLCPHAVWGSKAGPEGKGTACTVNTRLAVVDPEHVGTEGNEPYLLRVPAGSRGNFADVVKAADARGIPYNAMVLKVGFDREAPSPKLTFRLVGLLDDGTFGKVNDLYATELVQDIVGLLPARAAATAPQLPPPSAETGITEADLDAAIAARAARAATDKAKAAAQAPAPEAEPEPAPAPAPKAAKPRAAAKPKAEPAATGGEDMSSLLGDLDSLLSGTDD